MTSAKQREVSVIEGSIDGKYHIIEIPAHLVDRFVDLCEASGLDPLKQADAFISIQPPESRNVYSWMEFCIGSFIEARESRMKATAEAAEKIRAFSDGMKNIDASTMSYEEISAFADRLEALNDEFVRPHRKVDATERAEAAQTVAGSDDQPEIVAAVIDLSSLLKSKDSFDPHQLSAGSN